MHAPGTGHPCIPFWSIVFIACHRSLPLQSPFMESVNRPASLFLPWFVSLRLRFWAMSTAQAALRHWQFFALFVVLLVPIGTPLHGVLLVIASPLLHVLHEGQGVWYHFWRLCAIQALALGWILIQAHAVRGGAFMAWATSLPLSRAQRRVADVMVLLAANTLLLLPWIAMLSLAPGSVLGHGFATMAGGLVFTGLVLLAQQGVIEGRGSAVLPILGADFALSLGLSGQPAMPLWTGVLVAILLGASSLTIQSKRLFQKLRPGIARHGLPSLLRALSPVRRIQIKALFSQGSTAVRCLVLAVMVLGAERLMSAFRFDGRVLPTLVLALSVIALVVSGFYRTLYLAHGPMSRYLRSLPLPPRFWSRQDHVFVAIIGMLPLVPLLWASWAHIPVGGFVPALVVGYFLLLAGLRLPVIHGGRQALLLAFLMAAGWSGVALAAIP